MSCDVVDRFPVLNQFFNFIFSFTQGAPGKVKEAVETAIAAGYRHIDCAYNYQNEHEVGQAIRTKIADGTITRDDIWITTKVSFNENATTDPN